MSSARPQRRGDLLLDAAAKVRARLEANPEGTEELAVITFHLGSERFAIPIEAVGKIEVLPAITPVPQTPPFVRGVANHRGEIVPVIDLTLMFDMPTDRAPVGLLVMRDPQRRFAIITHSVPDTLKLSPDLIVDTPKGGELLGAVLSGGAVLGDSFLGIIDLNRLITLIARSADAE